VSLNRRARGSGAVLCVALALLAPLAARAAPADNALRPAAITESVVAPAEQLGKAFAAVAAHIKPAVVSVYSEKMVTVQAPEFPFGEDFLRRFFGQQFPQPPSGAEPRQYQLPERGMGSGMILDRQGHILTNYHVVSGVDRIKVQLADKRSFEAKIVGTDPKTDVAIIRIAGEVPHDLPTVQMGDSDALEDGNLVMAVGAPFGLTQTVTSGIVSAKGRADVGIATYEDFIQTDAPINPGNSGGPLVNMHGEVVGMTSAIATGGGAGQSAGVGFAIPSNMIKAMLPTLIKGGQITRGMLGVGIQDLTPDLAAAFHVPDGKGALISQVGEDSPAERAGLKAGDVVVRYGGNEVTDSHLLRKLVAATAPGTRVAVGAIRDGRAETHYVTIGKMPAEAAPEAAAPSDKAADRLAALGFSVQALTPDIARQLDLQGEKGVLISGVEPGSAASEANLQPGDLIVEVDRIQVASVAELHRALDKAKHRVLLLIKRQGATMFVVLIVR